MAKDLNQCNFIGRLGKDVEMRYLQSGDACANFSIAVGESWKDKTTGEKKEKTEWVNISCFGKLAEICGEYLKKGSKIYASGKFQTRKWQDQSGADRYSTGIQLVDMQMLDSRADSQQNGNAAPQQQNYQPAPQQQQTPQQMAPAYQQPAPTQQPRTTPLQGQPSAPPIPQNPATGAPAQYNEPSMDFDDDIPF